MDYQKLFNYMSKEHGVTLLEQDMQEIVNIVTESAIVGSNVLAAVPYQCCPLCNGNGQTVADGFTSSVYQTCKVCNGVRIIPMHIADWRFTTHSS